MSIGIATQPGQFAAAAAGGGGGLLLDDVPNAAIAVSMRLLRTAYSGNCLRVSYSEGLTDIGFSSGWLNTTALASVCGSNSAFLSIWYDQSGNGNDLVFSAGRPKIYDGTTGAVLFGGLPAALFDGGDDRGDVTPTWSANAASSGWYVAAQNIEQVMYSSEGASGTFDALANNQTSSAWGGGTAPTYRIDGAEDTTIDQRIELRDALWSGSAARHLLGVTNYNYGLHYSAYRLGGFFQPFSGHMHECVIYDSDKSASYATIEANINAAFSIY